MEHRLVGWQSAPSGGSTTPSSDSYLYDGEGRRVEQDAVAQLTCPPPQPPQTPSLTPQRGQRAASTAPQTSCGSSTTDTVYLSGDAEEIASNGSIVTSTTKNYSAGGLFLGTLIASGGTESLHMLASDGLGSVSVALDPNGNVTAQQLFGPYGGVRYTWGSMPTAKGFTGQQGDALTGLDYYGARYYDPLVGQFLTPDDVDAAGPNRYGYVGGNPETRTDPTGHRVTCGYTDCNDGGGGSSGGNGGHGGGHKSIGRCGGLAVCYQIYTTFSNQATQNVLLQLMSDSLNGSSVAGAVLSFLLAVGSKLGDAFISFASERTLGSGVGGYTDPGGNITLLAGKGVTVQDQEISLIHEAVEAYLTIQYGVRTASQRIDYAAQYFVGWFRTETHAPDPQNLQDSRYPQYDAYGKTFQQWVHSEDGAGYHYPPNNAEVVFGHGIAPGYDFTATSATYVGDVYNSLLDKAVSLISPGRVISSIPLLPGSPGTCDVVCE